MVRVLCMRQSFFGCFEECIAGVERTLDMRMLKLMPFHIRFARERLLANIAEEAQGFLCMVYFPVQIDVAFANIPLFAIWAWKGPGQTLVCVQLEPVAVQTPLFRK